MIFYWSMSERKSPQVSMNLLKILSDFNKAVVWVVSTRHLISKSSNPVINPLLTVPCALTTIGITVTFMFQVFFSSLARSKYLSFFSISFRFTLWSAGTAKSTKRQVPFFCRLSQGLVVLPILGCPLVSQNPRDFRVSHSLGRIPACVYTVYSHGQILISCTIPSGSS